MEVGWMCGVSNQNPTLHEKFNSARTQLDVVQMAQLKELSQHRLKLINDYCSIQ